MMIKTKHVLQKFIILTLFVLMFIVGFPTGVSAATIVDRGTLDENENISWTIDIDGVVTISGTGSMGNYSRSPWEDAEIPIKKVIIEEGVTSIARSAFDQISTLETVKFPSTLVSIDESAFAMCSGLKELDFPQGLTDIGDYAFSGCTSLKKIVIPKSIKIIDTFAFSNCSALKSVVFYKDIWMDNSSIFQSCHEDLTLYAFTDGNIQRHCESFGYKYCNPKKLGKVHNFYTSPSLGRTTATITWDKVPYADGYKLYKYNTKTKKYTLIKTLSASKRSHKLSGLKNGTIYRYRIKAYMNLDGKTYNTSYTNLKFRTRPTASSVKAKNAKISKGYTAAMKNSTKTYSELAGFTYKDYNRHWAQVSEISQFLDNKGNFCVAYSNKKNTYIYIRAYNKDFKQVYSRKIKQLYPGVGTVTCDKNGYFYILWGKGDSDYEPGTVTMAVSKYKKNGTLVKTYKDKTSTIGGAMTPFFAGNCDSTFQGDILIFNYALERYDGHQSNGVLAVNTKTMKEELGYSAYVSHAFDQRVLTGKDGIVWFVNHGDCFPRGFNIVGDTVEDYKLEDKDYTPFHFYAPKDAGDITLNRTNASLGGVAETSSGLVLVGSSVKTLKSTGYYTQAQNLFVMYADPDRKMEDGVSRSGYCKGKKTTDKSVKWLTSYTKYDVENPQTVYTDDDRIVILWEKVKPDGIFPEWKGTYYMILSSNGKILQKATKIKNVRLNANEEPIYKDGYIYWATCGKNKLEDKKLHLHRLNIKTLIRS